MVADPVFVDTNILVYAASRKSEFHLLARQRLIDLGTAGAQFWISRQVIREFLAVTSRRDRHMRILSVSDANKTIQNLIRVLNIAEDDGHVTALLMELLETPGAEGRQVHDASIVATMLRHGISRIFTHNESDFGRYAPRITVLRLIC